MTIDKIAALPALDAIEHPARLDEMGAGLTESLHQRAERWGSCRKLTLPRAGK